MTTESITTASAQAITQIAFAGMKQRRSVSAVRSVDVVVGGQFGSEAKGHVTQQVIKRRIDNDAGKQAPVLNLRVAGPNAGHTAYALVHHRGGDFNPDPMGGTTPWVENRAFAFRQLPVGIIEDAAQVFCGIAAGSEIELPVLLAEIKEVKDAGLWPRHRLLLVDPEATMLDDSDHGSERAAELVERIGSTGKGIGSARSKRIMRTAKRLADDPAAIKALSDAGALVRSVALLYSVPEAQSGYNIQYQVVIEGTQGYGLGLHAGAYPQCTSSDCRASDFLAMAGLSPWAIEGQRLKVWVVFRPFPIRVAGNSGPLARETTWGALGLPEERTTVTKKVRRVGRWDPELAEAAVRANGGGYAHTLQTVVMALSMADQIDPDLAGVVDPAVIYANPNITDFIEMMQTQTGAVVDLVTTSPSTAVWL